MKTVAWAAVHEDQGRTRSLLNDIKIDASANVHALLVVGGRVIEAVDGWD